jgi:hypothetical protein
MKSKYKYEKYLRKIKILMHGGDMPTQDTIKYINFFNINDPREQFLNPLYGVFYCNIGFIENIIKYKRVELSSNYIRKKINDLFHIFSGTVNPTKSLFNLNTNIIGKNLAKMYVDFLFCIQNKNISPSPLLTFVMDKRLSLENKLKKSSNDEIIKTKINNINLFITNSIEPFEKNKQLQMFNFGQIFKDKRCANSVELYFHLVLTILWMVAGNYDNIKSYYIGLNEYFKGVTDILNIIDPNSDVINKISPITIPENKTSTKFEDCIYTYLSQNKIDIFNYGYSNNFCENENSSYPDCGETTLRNFINILLYDDNLSNFDMSILDKYKATQNLKDYYNVFNSIEKQKSLITTYKNIINIDGRSAWAKFVVQNLEDVRYKDKCKNNYNEKYELKSGLNLNIKNPEPNFIFIIKKLFNVESIMDLEKIDGIEFFNYDENKKKFNTIDELGFGHIKFMKNNDEYIINLSDGHFYIESNINIEKKICEKLQYTNLFNYLVKNYDMMDNDNYFYYKITSELLTDKLNSQLDEKLYKKLFIISQYYDIDTKNRIKINIDKFSEDDLNIYDLNHYVFIISDTNKNKFYMLNNKINNFMLKSHLNLSTLDITNFKLKEIGGNFLSFSDKLTSLSLPTTLQKIGINFLNYSENLTSLTLPNTLQQVDDNFLYYCCGLTSLTLSNTLLEKAGDNFLGYCSSLTSLSLPNTLEKVGYNFLCGCRSLTSLTLPISLEKVDGNFLFGCKSLTLLTLSTKQTQIKEINKFMTNIKNINYVIKY